MDFWTKFLIILFLTYIITLNYLSKDNISTITNLANNYEIIKVINTFEYFFSTINAILIPLFISLECNN